MAMVFYCEDWLESVVLPRNVDGCLARLQEIVGGPIDVVPVGASVLVINARGKILGLPFNARATAAARAYLQAWDWGIAGHAVLARWEELELEGCDE